jgi:hypothetical protein
MASRRRTASSFSLGNDEDAREKKRKEDLCVNIVTGVDTTDERDGQKMLRVAGDHADDAVVRGSCLARKDIIVREEVGSGGVRHFICLFVFN